MAFLTRIVAAAALFSFAYAVASGPSAAENYAVAAQRAREHHQRAPLVRAAPDRVRKRAMQRRCNGSTPPTTTTSSHSTSKTWHPNYDTSSSSLHTSSTAQPPKQTPGNPSSGGGKKGLAWGGAPDELANFVNSHVKYIYDWRDDPPQKYGLQAASMLWGRKNLEGFRKNRAKYPILMGPNEFNLGSQAALSVSEVVALWNAEIRPYGNGKTLVSPSVTTAPDGITKMQEFFNTCGGNDHCGVNVLSIHYYGDKTSDLIDYATKMHNAFPALPVWLDEFSCQNFDGNGDCSHDEVWAFMEGVVKFCEKTDWIEAYFPFGLMHDLGNVNAANALMDTNGKPTALGSLFLNTVD